MRINAFSDEAAPLDCQPCKFPWNEEVTFWIYRSGRRAFAERGQAEQIAKMPKLIRFIAEKRDLTMEQMRDASLDLQAEWEAAIAEMPLPELLDQFGEDALGAMGAPDIEGIALYLVRKTEGRALVSDDSGKALGWHDTEGGAHVGTFWLMEQPDAVSAWIVTEANRIEAEFSAFMDAAAKNSPTSSAPSAEGEEVAPS